MTGRKKAKKGQIAVASPEKRVAIRNCFLGLKQNVVKLVLD
jgi:hypothetical protein